MEIIDQLGRTLSLPQTPNRIISLVPSQTELIVDLGLASSLLGVTKFCVHPKNIRSEKTVVGGTKEVKLDKIGALQPDLILCNKEENTPLMVKALAKLAPVHVSDVNTLNDAYKMIQQYGEMLEVAQKAQTLIEAIQQEKQTFVEKKQSKKKWRVAYFIWRKPWMVAGGNTFINELLTQNGFENAYADVNRYPVIELEELREVDFVLLSSEPFPFNEKYIFELEPYVNPQKIKFVDGEYFSWYGSRLKDAFAYFSNLQERLVNANA